MKIELQAQVAHLLDRAWHLYHCDSRSVYGNHKTHYFHLLCGRMQHPCLGHQPVDITDYVTGIGNSSCEQ